MFVALIDRGTTFLFNGENTTEIEPKNIMGFLINHKNIIDLINSLNIVQFYVQMPKGPKKKITREQAMYLYENLIDYQENIAPELKKVEKTRIYK